MREPAKFPGAWKGDAGKVFDFCARIVDATKDVVSAYKPQIAYFAAHAAEPQLERLIDYIHDSAPDVPVILDAKRGDMASTAEQYAREVFVRFRADAVTLSPLLGFDSIEPQQLTLGASDILTNAAYSRVDIVVGFTEFLGALAVFLNLEKTIERFLDEKVLGRR